MKTAIQRFDPVLFWLAMIASVVGLCFIFDAGYARSMRDGLGMLPREFVMQVAWLLVSVACGLFATTLSVESVARFGKSAWPWLMLSLFLVLIPGIGYSMGGAHRWFKVGPATVQPAEFAKIGVILYGAYVLATRKAWPKRIKASKNLDTWLGTVASVKLARLLPALWIGAAAVLIAIEPDLGTAAVLAVIAWVMFAFCGATWKSVLWVTIAGVIACGLFIKMEPYRMERITNHQHRWDSKLIDDVGYQTVQAELGMAAGGFAGVGFTAGRVKHVIPAPTTDFIPATIAEETGFFGWSAVTLVLGAMTWRIFTLAQKSATNYGSFVLVGLGTWIGVQSVVNLMMANGSLPAIGIPLPFISSGGSSLIALWAGLGLSQAAMQPATEKRKQEAGHAADRHGWRNRRTRLSGA